MGQITITAVATYGSTTLPTTIIFDAESVHQGVMTADTTYEQISSFVAIDGGTPQAVAVYNGGSVDVSVRLTYSTTKYAFLTVPPTCVVIVPQTILDSDVPVDWEVIAVKTVSGTVDVEYVEIR